MAGRQRDSGSADARSSSFRVRLRTPGGGWGHVPVFQPSSGVAHRFKCPVRSERPSIRRCGHSPPHGTPTIALAGLTCSSVGGLIQAAQPDGSCRDIVIFDTLPFRDWRRRIVSLSVRVYLNFPHECLKRSTFPSMDDSIPPGLISLVSQQLFEQNQLVRGFGIR